ncbi:MAG: hypothetical protein BGO49_08530 [Planctomycetales bacterium 71-10]|nr:MAG: hypothetical protein BGO49_08530 [Planctomycetales bacterium 71-10]
MGLEVVTPAAVEPISVEEAKAHARILTDADDALVGVLCKAARRHVEARCNRSLAVQTYELSLHDMPAHGWPWELPRPPLVSVESIVVRGPDGSLGAVDPSAYRVVLGTPGLVAPVGAWPSAARGPAAVTVRYVAGWTPEELPEDARVALLMLVAHWYDRREPVAAGSLSEVPLAVDAPLGGIDWRTRG